MNNINVSAALAYLKDARIAITEPAIRKMADDSMKSDIDKLLKDIQLLEDKLLDEEEPDRRMTPYYAPRRIY